VAAKALATYYELEKVTLSVTLAQLEGGSGRGDDVQVAEKQTEILVPPTRFERAARGLGNRFDFIRFRGLLRNTAVSH